MEIGSILLVFALFIIVILIVTRPFFEREIIPDGMIVGTEEHQVSTLLAERDQVLDALQELEFDYAIGKIPQEDYPKQRKILLEAGASILQDLDKYQVSDKSGMTQEESDYDKQLEAAIEARRAGNQGEVNGSTIPGNNSYASVVNSKVADPDDDLEVMIADRRRKRNDTSAGFCPECGGPVQKSDRFCPKCGTTMS